MRNRSQDKTAPRLLMEFNRRQEVPKLVTLQEVSRSKEARNKLLLQARTFHHSHTKNSNYHQMNTLHDSLHEQRKQNEDLKLSIKQLTAELQKLRQVNQGLIQRLKQVENSYRGLRNDLQRQQDDQRRRQKNSIYADIEQYIKMTVQRLYLNLKQEKMTPALENKLERFLSELMEINSVSVDQVIKKSRINQHTSNRVEPPAQTAESRATTIGRYLSDYKTKKQQLPSKEHYATIMQRLTGQANMSKSYAGAGIVYGSGSKENKLRTVYATTPSKRKRIFE